MRINRETTLTVELESYSSPYRCEPLRIIDVVQMQPAVIQPPNQDMSTSGISNSAARAA